MPTRRPISHRRELESFSFEHDSVKHRASIGWFEDGSTAELFINSGKLGSALHTMGRDAAVLYSIARQYGAPEKVLFDALSKLMDGSPAGPIGAALRIAGAVGEKKEREAS